MAKKAIFQKMYEDTPGGKYYRKIEGRRYHIIEWIDMFDACGKDATEKYNVSLKEIDLDTLPEKEIQNALRSCGYILKDGIVIQEYNNESVDKGVDLLILDACHGYSHGAPLLDSNGNNLRQLMADARAESLDCSEDASHYEDQMSRPVNAIGSTARELGYGDFMSAVDRGCREGKQEAKIIAKMHGIPQETIESVKGQLRSSPIYRVRLNKIPSTDPIACMTGFFDGVLGSGKAADTKDLATAYLEGYRIGISLKSGSIPKPEWVED